MSDQASKATPPAKKPSSAIPTSIPSRLPTAGTGIKKPTVTAAGSNSGQTSQTSSSSSIGGTATTAATAEHHAPDSTAAPAASKASSKIASTSSSNLKGPTSHATSATATTAASDAAKSQIPTVSSTSQLQTSTTAAAAESSGDSAAIDSKEVEKLKMSVKDLTEKLETLKLKRAEDRDKLREYEKSKLQVQQLQEFKVKAQELMSDLNKELQTAKDEAKHLREEFGAYKEEMSNHEQRIEEMTVDKELAEARLEELQDEINKLNDKNEELKLELDVIKGEIELNGSSGAATSFQVKQLEKEQERLKAALIKLRDLSLQDKNEISTLKKQNEDFGQKVKVLSKENESLKEEVAQYKFQTNELKDQVQATLGSVQMIEQLTEQNLDLEAKLIELRETIADLEAINEVNDQLQESAKEEEKELRQNLDISENRIREAERHIETLKYNLADQEKSIAKFRDLVKQLRSENDTLNRKLQSKLEEEKSSAIVSQSTTQYDFKQKFYETKNFAKEVENELNKIEIQNQKNYINYLLSFMSEQFLRKSNDHECLLALLFFKRLSSKADLLLNLLKKKNETANNASGASQTASGEQPNTASSSSSEAMLIEKQAFLSELFILLSHIKLICNKFEYVLNTCDTKVYYSIGSLYFDFNAYEKNLDVFFELLQKDQLDESISLDLIEKASLHLQTLYKNYLESNEINETTFIYDLSKYLTHCSESIGIDLKRVNALMTNKDETSEIMILMKDVSSFNDTIKVTIKKIQKSLPKPEDEQQTSSQQTENGVSSGGKKRKLALPNEMKKEFEFCVDEFFKLSKTLREIYNMASNLSLLTLDSSLNSMNSLSSLDADRILTSKKLESLAFQACDKIYTKEDNGPYENIRSSIYNLNKVLCLIENGLANGEYEVEISEEEYKIQKFYINAPLLLASEAYKKCLFEAENLKYKLEAKEDEIKELKKHLKLKLDELSEHKVRIGLSEKKTELAVKEMEEKEKKHQQQIDELKATVLKKEKEQTETMEALQKEIDDLQNERKDLKDKLRQLTKKSLFDNIMSRQSSMAAGGATPLASQMSQSGLSPSAGGPAGSVELAGSPGGPAGDAAAAQKLYMLDSPSLLVQELKLMRNLNKILMNSNKEIKKNYVLNLLGANSNSNKLKASNKKQATSQTSSPSATNALCKNSNSLLKELYESLVNVKVPKLDEKSQSKNEKFIKESKLNNDLTLTNKLNLIVKESDHIQSKLRQLKSTLPSTVSSAAKGDKSTLNEKVLMAEIRVPMLGGSAATKPNEINLNLKSREIKDILRNI